MKDINSFHLIHCVSFLACSLLYLITIYKNFLFRYVPFRVLISNTRAALPKPCVHWWVIHKHSLQTDSTYLLRPVVPWETWPSTTVFHQIRFWAALAALLQRSYLMLKALPLHPASRSFLDDPLGDLFSPIPVGSG